VEFAGLEAASEPLAVQAHAPGDFRERRGHDPPRHIRCTSPRAYQPVAIAAESRRLPDKRADQVES
jgi:hypothetical protein